MSENKQHEFAKNEKKLQNGIHSAPHQNRARIWDIVTKVTNRHVS